MARLYPELDEGLQALIRDQHIFFVGTAPLSAEGHVNVSPKGLDSFRILGPRTVAYLDLTGSGIETVSHLRENGRITLMFCTFNGRPRIVRLQGRGRVVEPGEESWEQLVGLFPSYPGVRAVIVVELDRISDSCGFGVPLYEYQGERTQMFEWMERKGEAGLEKYRKEKNHQSIDHLPGLRGSRPETAP